MGFYFYAYMRFLFYNYGAPLDGPWGRGTPLKMWKGCKLRYRVSEKSGRSVKRKSKISNNRLVCKNAVALAYYGSYVAGF